MQTLKEFINTNSQEIIEVINSVLTYNFKNANNNRSTKRTEILHSGLTKIFNKYFNYDDSYKILYEKEILEYNGTFCVDVAIYKDEKLISVILYKLYQSSITKNLKNIINTEFGEIVGRLMGSPLYKEKDVFNIFSISIYPDKTLIVNKTKNNFQIENIEENIKKIKNIKEHPTVKSTIILYDAPEDSVQDIKIIYETNDNFFKALKSEPFEENFVKNIKLL